MRKCKSCGRSYTDSHCPTCREWEDTALVVGKFTIQYGSTWTSKNPNKILISCGGESKTVDAGGIMGLESAIENFWRETK